MDILFLLVSVAYLVVLVWNVTRTRPAQPSSWDVQVSFKDLQVRFDEAPKSNTEQSSKPKWVN